MSHAAVRNHWLLGVACAPMLVALPALCEPALAQEAPAAAAPTDLPEVTDDPYGDLSGTDPLFWQLPPATAPASAAPAPAPQAEAPEPELEVLPGDIVVTATRVPGQVQAPEKPVATLEEEDIAAYGATSISDLLTAISPQTNSGRGRGGGMPVILVNGVRISSFRELRDYPPEAIRKVEILPEEVALRYGYPPDQRVVNFILKDKYSSRTVEVEYKQPTRGGTSTVEGQLSTLRIAGASRLNLTAKADHTTPLTEAERGVIQTTPSLPAGAVTGVPGDPNPADARTLVAKASNYSLNGTWTLSLGKGTGGGSLAINAAASRSDTQSLNGLTSVVLAAPDGSSALRYVPGAQVRTARTDTIQAGAALNKPLGQWQLSATVDGSHAVTTTLTDGRFDTRGLVAAAAAGTFGITAPLPALTLPPQDRARARNDSVTSLVTLTGRPLRLPGGATTLTLKGGFTWTGLESSDSRFQLGTTNLKRGDGSVGVNLGVPITSRREDFGAGLGDISLNFSAGVDWLSDFGRLTDWTAGATWGVTEKLGLQASYIVNQAAPSLAQLGNPVLVTPNVPVYDFATGRAVLVTTTTGGNPNLLKQEQRDLKLGLNWTLPFLKNSNLIVEYFNNRSSNVTIGLPLLTPAVEAAYPGRVTRVNGVIVAIDQRPVTLAEQREKRLRWGLNLGGDLGKEVQGGGRFGMMGGGPPAGAGGPPRGAGGGGGGGGFGRGGGGPRGPRHEGRWNLSLYHTWQFENRALLAPGTSELDLLNGDALASTGGVARHSLELDAGAFYKGFGLRMNGTWTAPTNVRPVGLPASSDLRFGSVTKLNLRLFADLGQQQRLVEVAPFFKGARVSLKVDNLFDSRQRVTDATGAVPLSYQPDYIDPLGRVIGIELRKLF